MSVKKLLVGLSAAAMIGGLAVGPALASAKIIKRNERTGAGSLNINRNEILNRLRDEHRNRADVRNQIDIFGETGDNDTEENTSAGDIATGYAAADVFLTNELNQEDVAEEEAWVSEDVGTDITEVNELTGADSTNKNILDLKVKRTYERVNRADLRNNVFVDGDTGDNDMKKNTEGGSTTTGNTSATVDILNVVN